MRSYRRLELAFRQARTNSFGPDEVPDLRRQRVRVRIDCAPVQGSEQFTHQLTPGAVYADLAAEHPQAGTVRHDDMKARAVSGFRHLPDARDNPESGEQKRNSVSEFPAGRCVVDLWRGPAARDRYVPVGRPQMSQEDGDLPVAG